MAARREVCRYPRRGERVAPATLRTLLLDEAPQRLVGGTAAAGSRLCDLDESVWEKLPPDVVVQLGDLVVAKVAAGCARKAILQRRLPRLPEQARLADLRLEHRTGLCLARAGLDHDLQALSEKSIGDVLSIRAFGPRSLVDLLSSLETALARGAARLDPRLTAEATRLLAQPAAEDAGRDDARFGPLILEVDPEAANARRLAERLVARTQDPPDPAFAAEKVRQLSQRLAAMPGETIEDELIQIFASTPYERNREIVIGYYGWRDGQLHTLAQIGARYGMTRERTRQICAKLVKRKNPRSIPAPVTDRALAFLASRLPGPAADLEQALAESGLTKVGLGLENVRRATQLLARPLPFELVGIDGRQLAVDPAEADLPAAVVELAKKEVYYHGLATVDRIRDGLGKSRPDRAASAAVVLQTLQLMDGFSWLDDRRNWFRLSGRSKHGLPRAIEKILSVAPAVTVDQLRAAVGRNRRMWRVAPPDEVIGEFCRQMPGLRVEGDRITAENTRPWRSVLTGVEKQLVEILLRHGPLMERGQLEELCVAAGMNRFSFHAFVACSPIIAQYGHSIYGLLGADVSGHQIESLAWKRRQERVPTRVLDGHGRTADGRVWLSYRLSKAASTYAVITVPAALKKTISGRFRLVSASGSEVGTLAAKDGRAWGLGAFLRRHQAKTDDRVRITLDLETRTAVIELDSHPSPARGRKAEGDDDLPSPARGRGAEGDDDLPSPARRRGAEGDDDLPSPARGRGAGGEGERS